MNTLLIHLLMVVVPIVVVTGQDYTCNWANDDNCDSAFDGVCDNTGLGGSATQPGCEDNDCFDCNLCKRDFNYDCNGCLQAEGCYYCPGDGTCDNSPRYGFRGVTRTCTSDTSFLTDPTQSCSAPNAFFNDPLWQAQVWAYNMINVIPVWRSGNFGQDVRIRINDDGVGVDGQAEFDGRFDRAASCPDFGPRPEDLDGHGTRVAGIIAGNADNNLCAAGIAPQATFSSCNIFAPGARNSDAFLAFQVEDFDISNNSWGLSPCEEDNTDVGRLDDGTATCPFDRSITANEHPCDFCDFASTSLTTKCQSVIFAYCQSFYTQDNDACQDFPEIMIGGQCEYAQLSASAVTALQNGINKGRDGKGIVYAISSGNDYFRGDDVNFSGFTNTRFTISVGAVGKNGKHATYSTPGAALVVVGPGGDEEDMSQLMTANVGGGCTTSGTGTSFSCPVVSGVIALMLQERPELTWRDVQGILATTSQRVVDNDDDTATQNGAGLWHSNLYGFGIVDANAAVNAAKDWNLYMPESMLTATSEDVNEVIPNDQSSVVTSTISVAEADGQGFQLESTVVFLELQHSSRGDLEVILESPQGTQSLLHPGRRPENGDVERWKLMTVRNWGESPIGDWKLLIKDIVTEGTSSPNDILVRWSLVAYGQQAALREASTPTTNPSSIPSVQPTSVPSFGPTETAAMGSPSFIPSRGPSLSPSLSFNPTSKNGSQAPSSIPSLDPTEVTAMGSPSVIPSESPNSAPSFSFNPTGQGDSQTPSSGPSMAAGPSLPPFGTTAPSSDPSSIPSENTPRPTPAVVTPSPTAQPTPSPISPSPTAQPTAAPTAQPTSPPTLAPTPQPTTLLDSPRPTLSPTNIPTTTPTPEPTASPTPAPVSPLPTMRPTAAPTSAPVTSSPSRSGETPQPISLPTNAPTLGPTTIAPIQPISSSSPTFTGATPVPSDSTLSPIPTAPNGGITPQPVIVSQSPASSAPTGGTAPQPIDGGPTNDGPSGSPAPTPTLPPNIQAFQGPKVRPTMPPNMRPSGFGVNPPSPSNPPISVAPMEPPTTTTPPLTENNSDQQPAVRPTLGPGLPLPPTSIETTPLPTILETINSPIELEFETVSIEELSITLKGVADVPEANWGILETALKSHSVEYIESILPVLHVDVDVHIASVSVEMGDGSTSRRHLQGAPTTCIIGFSEIFVFKRIDGASDLTAAILATLPFSTPTGRKQFANTLRIAATASTSSDSELILPNFSGVSSVVLPPTPTPSISPASKTNDNVFGFEDDVKVADETLSPDQKNDSSKNHRPGDSSHYKPFEENEPSKKQLEEEESSGDGNETESSGRSHGVESFIGFSITTFVFLTVLQ